MSFLNSLRILEEVVEESQGTLQEHGEPTGEGHEVQEEHDHAHSQPLIILFVFIGLLIGGILRELNKKTKFPYTPMLIIVGIILGNWKDSLGVIGQSAEIVSHINPHILLFVFIPVLIFESGFNCEWYVFKKALFNILILAGPGVLWGAVLLAFSIKVILGYDFEHDQISWAGALTMGSVLSATDPVAVVALLKELGASVRFGHLIEGESLFNDGTAMVFYQVFVELAKPGAVMPSVASVGLNFIRVAGGGPVLGFTMGLIGSLWLRRIIRDDVLTSTITFICCYIVFYMAEFTFFHVSGILSIVVLGLFMSAFGKTKIYPESEHAVHTVWSFCQYGCETIIFLLTGVLIGIKMMDNSTITSNDWVKLFLLYLCMIFMRFVMVATFYKILSKHSYGLSYGEFWVLIWGGLRGALGLTLALMVAVDEELPQRMRELTVFFMAGTATLSLLVNGTTCGALVNYMNLIEDPQIRKKILNNTLKKLVNATQDKHEQLKQNKYLNLANWDLVDEMTGFGELKGEIDQTDRQSLIAGNAKQSIALGGGDNRSTQYGGLEAKEVHSEFRLRILRLLKGLFWERYEEGQCGGEATRMLEESCNICLDNTKESLKVWENVYQNFTSKKTLSYFFKMKDWILIGGLCKSYITRHLAFIYEIVTTFLICAKEAKEIQHEFPVKNTWIRQILDELEHDIQSAERFLTEMSLDYEHIIKSIHSKRAAVSLLEYHKRFISEYKHKGYIDQNDYEVLRKDIDRKIVKIENKVFNWEAPNFALPEFPLFNVLKAEDIRKVKSQTREITFNPNQFLFEKGQTVDQVYIILKGQVLEQFKCQGQQQLETRSGVGAFISCGNVVNNGDALSTCQATTQVTVQSLSLELVKDLMSSEPKFKERIHKGSVIYLVQAAFDQSGPLGKLSENSILEFVSNAKYECTNQKKCIKLPYGGYLIEGKVTERQHVDESLERDEEVTINSRTYLYANREYYTKPGSSDVCYIEFRDNVETRDSLKNIMNEQEEMETEKKYLSAQVKNTSSYMPPEENA